MEFPSLENPAIIAFKGLPVTCKSDLASLVAKWAESPVLWIEDFLAPDAGGGGNSAVPSMDEADQILRRAFDVLCRIAERQARSNKVNCVVIKSRLCTTFELDRLIDVMIRCESHALLIIECQCSSEYKRRLHFNQDYLKDNQHWYKLKTWNEVEVATDEYDAQAWNLHFENSTARLPDDKRQNIRRLMVDVSSDGTCSENDEQRQIGGEFSLVITNLLSKETMVQLPNTVVYHDFRRDLIMRLLNAPSQKSNQICTGKYHCIFKYREALEAAEIHRCWVCESPISGPCYECCMCNLVLHKSCAEEPAIVHGSEATPYLDRHDEVITGDHFENRYYHFTRKHACDHCNAFSYECGSCLLNTHLKCRLMPTIVKHDCHPEHFLQIILSPYGKSDSTSFTCKGCNYECYFNVYKCFVCGYNYHIRCVAAPGEVKHKHGGYEHVMQLMYSFDGMEEQEEFWCDICNKDMDATQWFYRCKQCPYYVSHMDRHSRLPCKDTGRL